MALTLLSVVLHACGGQTATLEERLLGKLDDWVQRSDPEAQSQEIVDDVQTTVVETCGRLVMATATLTEQLTLPTTRREVFHFRVDVCAKLTVHRVYPQPEFTDQDTVEMICGEGTLRLFSTLCARAGLPNGAASQATERPGA